MTRQLPSTKKLSEQYESIFSERQYPDTGGMYMQRILKILLLITLLTLSGPVLFAVEKQEIQKGGRTPASAAPGVQATVLIQPAFSLHADRTAVLIMDYENDIMGMLPEGAQMSLLEKAGAILKASRQAHMPVIYIVVRFRDGYPEINAQNKLFSGLKDSGLLREGTSGAEIHAKVAPQPGDIIVTKRRVGAFSTTDLETILRSKNINTIVLFGISTSGVVLSTVRWAADMDYKLAVISDACADGDAEVHRVLMDKVFPRQAAVVNTQEFLFAAGAQDQK
jgi:nicotinamidase-related amidase